MTLDQVEFDAVNVNSNLAGYEFENGVSLTSDTDFKATAIN